MWLVSGRGLRDKERERPPAAGKGGEEDPLLDPSGGRAALSRSTERSDFQPPEVEGDESVVFRVP